VVTPLVGINDIAHKRKGVAPEKTILLRLQVQVRVVSYGQPGLGEVRGSALYRGIDMCNLPIWAAALIVCSPIILFVILIAIARYTPVKYCAVYQHIDGRINCPKDGMNQEVGICKHCPHFKKYYDKEKYVLCKYHERLGGDF